MSGTKTHKRLVSSAIAAARSMELPATIGLSELEIRWGGPSCGAAGGVVNKWPGRGFVQDGFHFSTRKDGRKTVVIVSTAREQK